MLCGDTKNSEMSSGLAAGTMADAVQARSSENRPSSTAAMSVGKMIMRPAASHAARPEPMATATAKMVKKAEKTTLVPLMLTFTSVGSNATTSAPTTQNQLTTIATHHSRG